MISILISLLIDASIYNGLALNAATFNCEYRPATSTYSHRTSTCKFLSVRL